MCAARREKKRKTLKTIHGCSEEEHVEVGVTEDDAKDRVRWRRSAVANPKENS